MTLDLQFESTHQAIEETKKQLEIHRLKMQETERLVAQSRKLLDDIQRGTSSTNGAMQAYNSSKNITL